MNPNDLRKRIKADAEFMTNWAMNTAKATERKMLQELFDLGASARMKNSDVMDILYECGYEDAKVKLQTYIDRLRGETE